MKETFFRINKHRIVLRVPTNPPLAKILKSKFQTLGRGGGHNLSITRCATPPGKLILTFKFWLQGGFGVRWTRFHGHLIEKIFPSSKSRGYHVITAPPPGNFKLKFSSEGFLHMTNTIKGIVKALQMTLPSFLIGSISHALWPPTLPQGVGQIFKPPISLYLFKTFQEIYRLWGSGIR